MNSSDKRQAPRALRGPDVYNEATALSKKLTTDLLVRMIDSAADYHSWSLSDEDSVRLVKLIRHKQRIICSSFAFQLKKQFADFNAGKQDASADKVTRDWKKLGLVGATDAAEIDELEAIAGRYDDAFKQFERTILKRLQACIKRPRASVFENPLHVKRLCESFQYAIDSLNLAVNFKIALYRLFADRFIEALGPLYRRVDRFLHEQGMLPELPPARIHLRPQDGLSASSPPVDFEPDQSASLLMLLQRFKEKSRQSTNRYQNLFPELKQRFARYGIDQYGEPIDQLNLIFKLIFEDEDLPAKVKQQLARLQIYVFITAIQEDGFLRRSSNPARRLLDGIIASEVEIARQGKPESSGAGFLREYIDELASREFITIESYSEMLAGYQNFLKRNEAATRSARRAEAARKVMPLVKSRLAEVTQPLRVQGTSMILFEKVWLPLMVQIALHKGMDSEAWHQTNAMIKKQVWSLIPKSTEEEQKELLKTLPQVAHSLHRAMRSLKLAESLQQSLRDYLKLEQQDVVDKTAENIAAAKRRSRSLSAQSLEAMHEEDTTDFDAMLQTGVFQVPKDMLEAFNSAKSSKPKKINQVEALGLGDWLHLKRDGKGALGKLAWKAEDANLFIFVDRDGGRICEVDAEELGQMFESGDASLMEGASTDAEKTQFSIMKSL